MHTQSQALFQRYLEYFRISNFQSQIAGYAQTYAGHFADKMLSEAELETALREGFYLGEHKSHLGDYLTYSSIPQKIKNKWPTAKVFVAPHGAAKAVFANNPHVDAICELPGREPVGAFREFGFGNSHQRRQRIFGFFELYPGKPVLYLDQQLDEQYRQWKARLLLGGRKLVLVQSSGRTLDRILSRWQWRRLLKPLTDQYLFVQVGSPRDQSIFSEIKMIKTFALEELFCLYQQADVFLGPNSGPMHVMAGLGVPSVILEHAVYPGEVWLPLLGDNLALPRPVNYHLFHVYPWHYHLVQKKRQKHNPRFNPPDEPSAPCAEELSAASLARALAAAAEKKEPETWQLLKPYFST